MSGHKREILYSMNRIEERGDIIGTLKRLAANCDEWYEEGTPCPVDGDCLRAVAKRIEDLERKVEEFTIVWRGQDAIEGVDLIKWLEDTVSKRDQRIAELEATIERRGDTIQRANEQYNARIAELECKLSAEMGANNVQRNPLMNELCASLRITARDERLSVTAASYILQASNVIEKLQEKIDQRDQRIAELEKACDAANATVESKERHIAELEHVVSKLSERIAEYEEEQRAGGRMPWTD